MSYVCSVFRLLPQAWIWNFWTSHYRLGQSVRCLIIMPIAFSDGALILISCDRFQARFAEEGKTILHYDVEINPVVKVQNQKKPVGLLREVWAR